MKKNFKISFILLLIIIILLPITYSYAMEKINQVEKEKAFFEIAQLEASPNEKIEMTIYFEKISYDKFEFTLQSNSNVENVEVTNSGNAQVQKSSDELAITIDKAQTNVNQIMLYYQVPETAQVNDVIQFTATVTNMVTEEITDMIQPEITNDEEMIEEDETETRIETETKEENNQTETKTESQSVEVQVRIIEKSEEIEENEPEQIKKEDDKKLAETEDKKMQERKSGRSRKRRD